MRKQSAIRIVGQLAYVELTLGYEAVIDASNVHLVAGRTWCASLKRRPDGTIRSVYARANRSRLEPKGVGGSGTWIWLHKVLMPVESGQVVDHRDGDGLNNRMENLRAATHAENSRNQQIKSNNTSGYKGVSYYKSMRKWVATINIPGRGNKAVGFFDTKEAAAAAYHEAAAEHHGEFART